MNIQAEFHDKLVGYKINNANTVGFIGLGNMGQGMAKNLLDKGHEVVAFDVSPSVLDEAVSVGAKKATSPKVHSLFT